MLDAAEADAAEIEVIADNTEEVLDSLDRALAKALESVGIQAEGDSKDLCPVDTGRLRNSITHVTDGRDVYIGTNVHYAPYVELGTVHMKPRPFLSRAVKSNADVYREIFREALEGA